MGTDESYEDFLKRNSEMIAKWPKWKRELFERTDLKKKEQEMEQQKQRQELIAWLKKTRGFMLESKGFSDALKETNLDIAGEIYFISKDLAEALYVIRTKAGIEVEELAE